MKKEVRREEEKEADGMVPSESTTTRFGKWGSSLRANSNAYHMRKAIQMKNLITVPSTHACGTSQS